MVITPVVTSKKEFSFSLLCFWLIAILLPLAWYWPRILHASFSMIDDPSDLLLFSSMQSNFADWFFDQGIHGEVANGRFRPLYWLVRFFYFLIAGMHPTGWTILHYANMAITLSATFFLVHFLTKRYFVALLACALWSFSPHTMENYVRLATQEVWQVLYLSLLFLAGFHILRQSPGKGHGLHWGIISALIFALYFTKETSIVLLPFSIITLLAALIVKKRIKTWTAFFLINLSVFTLQHTLAPSRGEYASQYVFQFETIFSNLKFFCAELQWSWLLLGLFILYSIRISVLETPAVSTAIHYWQSATLTLGIAFFAVYLPWGEPVTRYLLIAEYCFAVFMSLELSHYINAVTKKNLSIWTLSALLIFANSSPAISAVHGTFFSPWRNFKGHVYALRWFADHAKTNANVIVLEYEMELLHSNLAYLQRFFHRNDLTVYSPSPYAESYQKQGYAVIPLTVITEEIIDKTDYIIWQRRGPGRADLEQAHQQIMNQLFQSKYQSKIKNTYSELVPTGGPFPEGTEIWKIDHEPGQN
ncbi:MAG: hypothetical protein HYZ84_02505 [Candidatus Omnitrophica bacterium]|nr:hypothetical protein [Candidatus Omnitrophota bacterium]